MDDSHPFRSMSIGHPIPEIRLFQTLTLKLQGQGHGCGQRARSYNQPSILLICFLFISHQSIQQFLRYSYFEIWPWNIQGQGHEWGQRSRSHIIPSIQLMHFLFVSHQLPKPKIYFPWRTQHENIPNTHVSAYCRYSLRSKLTYINMKTQWGYIYCKINGTHVNRFHLTKCTG